MRNSVIAVLLFAATTGWAEPDYARHVAALQRRLPSKQFTIVAQPPFVVAGDEPAEVVRAQARQTVKWAVDLLKKDFFTNNPPAIIDIWLFRDEVSYERHTEELFGEKPVSPPQIKVQTAMIRMSTNACCLVRSTR